MHFGSVIQEIQENFLIISTTGLLLKDGSWPCLPGKREQGQRSRGLHGRVFPARGNIAAGLHGRVFPARGNAARPDMEFGKFLNNNNFAPVVIRTILVEKFSKDVMPVNSLPLFSGPATIFFLWPPGTRNRGRSARRAMYSWSMRM